MCPWFKGPGSTNKQHFGRGQFRLPRVEGVEGVRLQGECGDHMKYVECSGTQTRRCHRVSGFARSKVLAGNALTIRTPSYRSPRKCCKQKTYGRAKPFRCNTYKKQGVGGPLSHCTSNSFLLFFLTSLPRHPYLLTSLSLTAIPALPATLFHPWHANVSANIFSPISIGAKRLRAPFAFRRIPPFLSRQTINIAGSKSVPVTAR